MVEEKEIRITIRTVHVGKEKTQDAKKQVEKLGKAVEKTGKTTANTSKQMGYNLTFIAWHFRYLGNIFQRVSQQWMRMAKDWIQTAADIEESTFGIKVAAALFGREAEKSIDIVQRLVETGLIEWKDASEAVRNLMLTGLGTEELSEMMDGLLSMSTMFTVAGKDLGDSINKVSAATLRGTALMQSDLLTRTLLKDMTNAQTNSLGKSWAQMTKLQRAQALYNKVTEYTVRTGELWRGEAGLMAGQIYKLETNIQLLKSSLGQALRPVLDLVSDIVAGLRTRIESLTQKTGSLLSIVTMAGIVFTSLFATFAVGMGVYLSFVKIINHLRLQMISMNAASIFIKITNWQVFLGIMALSAAIVGLTYLYLKSTGKLDKWRASLQQTNDVIAETAKRFEELGGEQSAFNDLVGESEGIDEERRIAHQRTVEDIEEDLERERSKGLWANQMSIQDLEKRLKRENEDWSRYMKGQESLGDEDTKTKKEKSQWEILTQAEKLKQILEDTKEHLKQLNELYKPWWKKLVEGYTGLPPIVQGAMAGIAVYIATIGIPALIALSSNLGNVWLVAKVAFAKILEKFTFLKTIISTPIAMSIFITAAVTAISAVSKHMQLVNKAIKEQGDVVSEAGQFWFDYTQKQLQFYREGKISWEEYQDAIKMSISAQEDLRKSLISPQAGAGMNLWDMIKAVPGAWAEFLWGGQSGGIVPGMRNQPVPILAHGGERVIPAGEVGGGGITVNINNPSVRSENDIQSIARAVSQALGQRQKFARLGAL